MIVGSRLTSTNVRAFIPRMSEHSATKRKILREAADLASLDGLDGVTIGSLAERAGMSKSGLFRHFGSKEQLQVETLRAGVERFRTIVILPTLSVPSGIPRLRRLFERWMRWESGEGFAGGCIFVAASVELDDHPGPARDFLVQQQSNWLSFLATTVAKAIQVGDLGDHVDSEQFAFEFHAMVLGFHHTARLMGDPSAPTRARAMFDRLLDHASPQE